MRAVATAAILLLVLAAPAPGETEDRPNRHAAGILEALKDRKDAPAGEVFRNVQLLKNVSAARLLSIMDFGYSRSLGVGCDHCHDEDRWDADDKRPKRATREMILFVRQLNENLGRMENVEQGPDAFVNCNTCHRGFVKPSEGTR